MLWTLQSWGMRLQLLSFMAGASRGCWPAQGGLLPGLQEAVVASMVELVESRGPRNRGQGHNRLTNLCPKCHQAAHLEQWIWKGFWEQTGHRQTSTSRVSGFRGPQQGVSQACVSPIWKQIHREWEAEGLRPDDHTTEWPQCCTLPWQSRNRPESKFKRFEGVLPKFTCWSSFIAAPDVVHCVTSGSFQFKMQNFKEYSKWVLLSFQLHQYYENYIPSASSNLFNNAQQSHIFTHFHKRWLYCCHYVKLNILSNVNGSMRGFFWGGILFILASTHTKWRLL